jgi:hypothetical protein
MNNLPEESTQYKNRTICLPCDPENYETLLEDPNRFRAYLDRMNEAFPELFPPEIESGYRMKDRYHSKKLDIDIRRIDIGETSYSIRPSFVMPYMTALVEDVEKVLFLRKFAVPFWALAYVFGRDPMYWYRMERSLGRNSIVGTTINDPAKLPQHLCADEKHSWILGEKVYIATTVGAGCILGASIAESAGENDLKDAYAQFKQEAKTLATDYMPKTVNTDGWEPTQKAWQSLFPKVTVILCILHLYIKMRDGAKKKFKEIFQYVATRLWYCYDASRRGQFSQRVRRFYNWASSNIAFLPSPIFDRIAKLHNNLQSYSAAYAFPGCHRTSNMLERLVHNMDRFLFSIQYFHGYHLSANLSIRAWALIHNFAPFNPNACKKHGVQSPAEKLNGFRYHDSWLQNLLISASLGGFRSYPQKT